MEKTIKQLRREFLDETVTFYSKDPTGLRASRRSGGSMCYYLMADGRRCAIGRYIIQDIPGLMGIEASVISLLKIYPTCLPQEVLDLGIPFLSEVQTLHDGEEYWGEKKGLTQLGEEKVVQLINRYCV